MKTKKKSFFRTVAVFALSLALLAGFVPEVSVNVKADDAQTTTITAYVTVSDSGSFVKTKDGTDAVRKAVNLSGKSSYTCKDLFEELHKEYCTAGADGFGTSDTEYGLSISKFWGVETYSVSYYVNDKMAGGLTDEISNGAEVYAFIMSDAWESYTYFDKKTAQVQAGDSLELTLNQYDWSINGAVSKTGASVTVDGTLTGKTTDTQGKVTLTFDKAGTFVVSAVLKNEDGSTAITAPYCVVSVTKKDQTITVKNSALKKTLKAKKLAKKKRSFNVKAKALTSVKFKKLSGSKKLTISKAGKVTVKKGTKKGTYKIKVKITAAASDVYNEASVTRTIKVKVK